ncbi:MAG: YdcF family protein [Clostridiales bacterium]|nr:YdcF family protein [Clostridiales bacterium]
MGCLILGILCLFYYVGIVFYAGITTSFSKVWLSGGAVLILLWSALRYQRLHPYVWLRCLTGLAFVLIAAMLVITWIIGGRIAGAMRTAPQQDLEYVIVLGAQVRGTSPSLSLKKRLECAAGYAEENPETLLILSGGQGSDEGISEAECMYRCLVGAGVSEKRLLMEDASTSTRENLAFSAEIIRGLDADATLLTSDLAADTGTADAGSDRTASEPESEEESVSYAAEAVTASVGVLSSDFHIYRALLLARQTGYTNVSGIPAESVPVMQPHNILREICAVLVLRIRSHFF